MSKTNSKPTISIAIPVYNGADFLQEALDSINAQTDQDFEVAVSDNASTDDTPRILAAFAASRPNVVISRSPKLILQGDNTSRAVSLCSGQWVKLLCHDDLLHPECIATMRDALSQVDTSNVGVVGHDEEWLLTNGHRTTAPKPEPYLSKFDGRKYLQHHLAGGGGVGVPSLTTAMVKKEAYDGTPGFDARFLLFDVFFWYRLLLKWDYVFVNRILTVNRIHGGQVAVAARNTLRAVHDNEHFWPEFLEEARELHLSFKTKTRLRLKAHAQAATYMAIELLKGRVGDAASIMKQMPRKWWPVLVLLTLRSFWRERIRTRELASQVDFSVIYPEGDRATSRR